MAEPERKVTLDDVLNAPDVSLDEVLNAPDLPDETAAPGPRAELRSASMPGWVQALEAIGRLQFPAGAALRGATYVTPAGTWADEAKALGGAGAYAVAKGIKGLLGGVPADAPDVAQVYETLRQQDVADEARAFEEHKGEYRAGEAGSLMAQGGLKLVKNIPSLIRDAPAAWRAAQTLRGLGMAGLTAATAGAEGGVLGAVRGAGEADPGQRVAGAEHGAEMGALFSLPFGFLSGLARSGYPAAQAALNLAANRSMARALGGNVPQANRLGEERLLELGQIARDEKLVPMLGGPDAIRKNAKAMRDEAGARLGARRAQIDSVSPGVSTAKIQKQIGKELGADIAPNTQEAPVLEAHRQGAQSDLRAVAQASAAEQDLSGARGQPVKPGPEGDKQFWQMTRDQVLNYGRMTPQQGAGSDPAYYQLLRDHRRAVAEAIVSGQYVPPRVMKDYPDLADLAPSKMNLETIAAAKKRAGTSLAKSGRTPDTLGPEISKNIARRDNIHRGVLQGFEEGHVGAVQGPAAEAAFTRDKNLYGAGEQLLDPMKGVTEGAAKKDWLLNRVFNLPNQLTGVMAAESGDDLAQAGWKMALARALYKRGDPIYGNMLDYVSRRPPAGMPSSAFWSVLGQLANPRPPVPPAAPPRSALGLAGERR